LIWMIQAGSDRGTGQLQHTRKHEISFVTNQIQNQKISQ
jgi:hypothetical protein